jgi:hypothetical protein
MRESPVKDRAWAKILINFSALPRPNYSLFLVSSNPTGRRVIPNAPHSTNDSSILGAAATPLRNSRPREWHRLSSLCSLNENLLTPTRTAYFFTPSVFPGIFIVV